MTEHRARDYCLRTAAVTGSIPVPPTRITADASGSASGAGLADCSGQRKASANSTRKSPALAVFLFAHILIRLAVIFLPSFEPTGVLTLVALVDGLI